MKLCKDCAHFKMHTMDIPMPNGQMMPRRVEACMNSEFREPIYGEPLPCAQVRRELAFCGIQGKGFAKKEEEPSKPLIQI